MNGHGGEWDRSEDFNDLIIQPGNYIIRVLEAFMAYLMFGGKSHIHFGLLPCNRDQMRTTKLLYLLFIFKN